MQRSPVPEHELETMQATIQHNACASTTEPEAISRIRKATLSRRICPTDVVVLEAFLQGVLELIDARGSPKNVTE